jgi:hypothetical protein
MLIQRRMTSVLASSQEWKLLRPLWYLVAHLCIFGDILYTYFVAIFLLRCWIIGRWPRFLLPSSFWKRFARCDTWWECEAFSGIFYISLAKRFPCSDAEWVSGYPRFIFIARM